MREAFRPRSYLGNPGVLSAALIGVCWLKRRATPCWHWDNAVPFGRSTLRAAGASMEM
jgi:hypothetical protein